jgi:hypothetical protein
MLLRFAKVAGGLRILVFQSAPIVATSVGLLSARTVAYFVGFCLGSIASIWLPIIALLVSVTGFFGAGASTPECEAYRAQMRVIDSANRAALASWQIASQPYIAASRARSERYVAALRSLVQAFQASGGCIRICEIDSIGFLCWGCMRDNQDRIHREANAIAGPVPIPPPQPQLQTYPACSSPNCPPGKKVWVQVIWASPSSNFSEPKGCFIVAYSQDAPTLPPNIEYNPFLPAQFVRSRAISYYLVEGDRFRGLRDNDWQNLESVSGWDKGYWKSEQTDPECRGWRPGWSKIVK